MSDSSRRALAVLGATGSIGRSTLDVVARNPERFDVVALAANRDVDGLYKQILQFKPRYAVMADSASAAALEGQLKSADIQVEVLAGPQALVDIAQLDSVDTVMAAIVGAAGLPSALAAAQAGKRLLLANKESLVVAGQLLMDAVVASGCELLPIDSEHNAVFQCWPHGGASAKQVRRILLTASGGPFREWTVEQMAAATPEQAVAHPNWSMGAKISVDSASMMNKGLEVIEACWLFNCQHQQVDVVVHPKSIVHSMVEYIDGSVLAELGHPDMRTPIAHAMAWPERVESGVGLFDLTQAGALEFFPPDEVRFPCLRLAREASDACGAAPAALNAANEIAVELFLNRKVGFSKIAEIVETVLNAKAWATEQHDSLAALLEVDREARALATQTAEKITLSV
ncbi:MAG: 1-deoxy-D-xylulose-5-phosphate reductoisomerase [Gammaproteobacteria bacterium]|nr:1-deoxy-D-xylulose-5-phosphate reductoisomerase [Gammaproteobacteria bacterium]